jgi:hypothetical protein
MRNYPLFPSIPSGYITVKDMAKLIGCRRALITALIEGGLLDAIRVKHSHSALNYTFAVAINSQIFIKNNLSQAGVLLNKKTFAGMQTAKAQKINEAILKTPATIAPPITVQKMEVWEDPNYLTITQFIAQHKITLKDAHRQVRLWCQNKRIKGAIRVKVPGKKGHAPYFIPKSSAVPVKLRAGRQIKYAPVTIKPQAPIATKPQPVAATPAPAAQTPAPMTSAITPITALDISAFVNRVKPNPKALAMLAHLTNAAILDF